MNDEALLREALEFVGASELERDELWERMRRWHFAVATRFNLTPEPWADPDVTPFEGE